VQLLAWVNVLSVALLAILYGTTGSLSTVYGFEYYAEIIWMSWGMLSGTGGSPDGPLWPTRFVQIVVAILAMFVFALICGFVEQAINDKLEELRRGKGQILEEGFVLILGWTDRMLPLVQQLCLAHEEQGGGVIVVLADVDKIEMDDFFSRNLTIEDRYGTTIITREGSGVDPWMLEKCSARAAKAIVVLSDPLNPTEGTAQAVRMMIALIKKLGDPGYDGITGSLIVEVGDPEQISYATMDPSIEGNGREDQAYTCMSTLYPEDLIMNLLVQCSIEPGLVRVFGHILAFEDNEFYFKAWPSLYRRRFADVVFMFEKAVPFGIKLEHPNKDGIVFLINPPGDQIIEHGDEVIVIADDANAYAPGPMHLVESQDAPDFDEPEQKPKQILVMGFRPDIARMINDLDGWVAKGSRLMLFCEEKISTRMFLLLENGLTAESYENMTLDNREGNCTSAAEIEQLQCGDYDATIILSQQREIEEGMYESPLDSDSRTLVTSIIVRNFQKEAHGNKARDYCTNVAEILDTRSQALTKGAKLNDYVCTNDMVAMVLAQAALEPEILSLMEELFRPDGSELHIKDIRLYAREGEALNWWELTSRARLRAHAAIGYIKQSVDAFIPPVLNPEDKDEKHVWCYGDKLVVFSED